jgi:hypothetical protein
MDKSIIIKRDELYSRVWQITMTKLAEEYGISGNGLKKICIKLKVPFPPIGYWQKIAAGHKIEQPPLPDINNGEPDFYELKTEKKPDYPIDEKYRLLIKKEEDPYNKINVTKKLGLFHPLISITKNILLNQRADSDGLIRRVRAEILSIAVSPKNLSRALNIMNTLIKELEKRNFQIKIEMNYHERNETFAIKDGQKIQIELRETLKMNKIKVDKVSSPWRQSDYERIFVPTGELRIEIKNVYSGNFKKIFKDQTNQLLENQLNDFIINIYRSINYLNLRNLEWEEERKIQEESEKEQNIILEKQRLEEEKTKNLFKMVRQWHKANLVRSFINEFEKKFIEENTLTQEKKNWIQWARDKAEALNPLNDMTNLNIN